ncbi:MAG: SpoIID/LytB domain-containing protein [Gaiellaceae bacterium]
MAVTARKLTFALLGVVLVLLGAQVRAASPTPPAAGPPRLTKPIFVITGHGWGHGIGMGQYGAYGFARAGYDYRRILAHYYRGTTLGPAPLKRVRVLLAAGRASVTVSSEAPFKVIDAFGETFELNAGRVTIKPDLKLRPIGELQVRKLVGPLTFTAGSEPVALDRPYRGTLVVSVEKNTLTVINNVGLEQYLWGVVPSEMPHTWPAEALKAQAVAARSYALSHLTGGAFDLYSDTRSQVYRGIPEEEAPASAAVNATAGQVVLYRGKVASTYFHSTSGGRTASIADAWPGSQPVPYLVSVPDPYDNVSPYHDWGPVVVNADRLAAVLKVPGRLIDARAIVNGSQRATSVVGIGLNGEGPAVTGTDFRRALDLRSSWFTLGTLALERPSAPLAYGARFQLRGLARGLGKVSLERRATGDEWTAAGTLTAKAAGTFAVTVRPGVTTAYRLVVGDVRTAAVRVAVAPVVRFAAANAGTALRGTVKPALEGTVVQVERLQGSAWKPVAGARVASTGRFEATVELKPGSYRARVGAARGLVAGTSSVLTVSPA